jgi:poly(U)-specific endoribonuclease
VYLFSLQNRFRLHAKVIILDATQFGVGVQHSSFRLLDSPHSNTIMDSKIEQFYNEIYSDLTVDREEATELTEFLSILNPPPDKLTKLRATAFKVACNYLSDDNDKNVQLLRTINCVVHAVEQTCMEPKKALANAAPLNEEALCTFYNSLLDGMAVDLDESEELNSYFKETNPLEQDSLVTARALAFKVGSEHLTDNKDTNVEVLRCINVIIHALEMSCYQPKPFHLRLDESVDLSMDLSAAAQHLWNNDVNRLTPGDDYVLNVQTGKKPFWKEDTARDPLFTSVDKAVWKRPTYAAFHALLDNYTAETGAAETVGDSERSEVANFLSAIMETAPMQFCHKYCHAHGKAPADRAGFVKLLQSVWFDLYRRERGGRLDSSGFEHVFIGEVKNGEVSGFHNWINFYLEEQKGALDYRGYIKPRGNGEAQQDENDYLLTLQFAWNGVEKFVGTSFIGVSPEFEMALYTMCFLVGDEENNVQLDTGTDTFGLTIKCYTMAEGKIGTTFPEVSSHYEDED